MAFIKMNEIFFPSSPDSSLSSASPDFSLSSMPYELALKEAAAFRFEFLLIKYFSPWSCFKSFESVKIEN